MTSVTTNSGYYNINTYYYTTTNTSSTATATPSSGSVIINSGGSVYSYPQSGLQFNIDCDKKLMLQAGEKEIQLPDGTVIDMKDDGSYTIIDKDAKTVYKGCSVKEFNKYINASDILEEFVKFLGKIGAKQNDVMGIPIEVFIHWLIVEAAKADGDTPPEENVRKLLTTNKHNCKCKSCGKFITKQKFDLGINFCNPQHLDKYMLKNNLQEIQNEKRNYLCTP